MPSTKPEELHAALHWRYATKSFDPARKVPAEALAALEEALRFSPSSFGMQPWKFLVVSDAALRKKLRAAAWDQPQVTDCSHYVVLAHRTNIADADVERLIHATAEARHVPAASLAGYKAKITEYIHSPATELNAWAAKQTYIALGFLLEAAALLGIDACPMEGFDPLAFNEILGLPAQNLQATVTCALGYRAPHDKHASAAKVRYPAGSVIQHL